MNLLEQDIQDDINERVIQMTTIKTLSSRYSYNSSDEQFILNYSFPIVYSIWEGFIQTAFQIYIRELNKLNLSIDNISEHILIFSMESSFKQLFSYPQKHNQKITYFGKMMTFFKSSNSIYINPVVNTESNVGFNVLNKILGKFNLKNIPEYINPGVSTKYELDDFLLKIRNGVAHGNSAYTVSRDDLERAISLVTSLMDLVLISIKDGFSQNSHLAINP